MSLYSSGRLTAIPSWSTDWVDVCFEFLKLRVTLFICSYLLILGTLKGYSLIGKWAFPPDMES